MNGARETGITPFAVCECVLTASAVARLPGAWTPLLSEAFCHQSGDLQITTTTVGGRTGQMNIYA
jgi:hypothetical protein